MKLIRNLGISLVAGAAALSAFGTGAMAQTSLQDVLDAARAERQAVQQTNQEREQRFLAERNTQQQKLSEIRSQVNAETARSNQLDSAFAANRTRIEELQAELDSRQGEFAELFGAARSAASDLATRLDDSIISSQFPGRSESLRETAESETLPTVAELENLYFTLLQEMVAQAEVATYPAEVVRADGTAEQREVTRIGPFSVFESGNYMTYEGGELELLARQPAVSDAQSAARTVEGYNGDGFVRGVIDPSLGTLLELVVTQPSIMETIQQGRTVGYVILGILAIGLLLGLYKLATLWAVNGAVRSQMRKKTPSKSNPLGRIMMAYDSNRNADVETVALKLDDAVLKEVPKLEGGLNLIKVLAAVAPLLGLLGTVIGMIRTFQAITLYGTGDPQLMASGISEALVTTVLGLVAAIPLLLIHAFASGAAKSVSQVLEEQSAGMIAEHAESRS